MNIENTYTLKNGIKNTFIFLFTTIAVPFIIPLLLPLEVYSDILKEKENNKASLVWSRVVSFIGAIFSLVILPPCISFTFTILGPEHLFLLFSFDSR